MVQKNAVVRENESSTFNVNQNRSRNNQNNKFCHNCQMNNHYTRDCRKMPFCKHHQTTGHKTSECGTLANRASSNNYRQDRPTNQQYRNQGAASRYTPRDQNSNYHNSNRQYSNNNANRCPDNFNQRQQGQTARQNESNQSSEGRHNAVNNVVNNAPLPRNQESGNFPNPPQNRGER